MIVSVREEPKRSAEKEKAKRKKREKKKGKRVELIPQAVYGEDNRAVRI